MKHLYTILFLIAFQSIKAQLLWSDNFDSYSTGALSTDLTGSTAGQGGWYVVAPKTEINIVPEAGRGKVMAIEWKQIGNSAYEYAQKENIDILWNSRNKVNNIFKLEFELYAENTLPTIPDIYTYLYGENGDIIGKIGCQIRQATSLIMVGSMLPKSTTANYDYKWIKVEVFIDFNTNSVYYYIPNYLFWKETGFSYELLPYRISVRPWINGSPTNMPTAKLDNFKISAIPTLPSYLNIDEILAAKFNVFPNPASDIVTITNNENIGVQQIEVYDVIGKNIKSQEYNNENEIQLNISDLVAGTYMFHVKTNLGTAVKKVVKK